MMVAYTKLGIEFVTKKYRPLYKYLSNESRNTVELSLEDVEKIISAKLPKLATDPTAGEFFWNNNDSSGCAWLEADYGVESFDHDRKSVKFQRLKKGRLRKSAANSGPARRSKTFRVPNPKILECWFCKKDDIKYGATVCSGCQAQIVYETHSTQAENEKFLFWMYFIGLTVGISIVVGIIGKVFFGGLDEEVFWWIIGISLVLSIFLTLWHQKRENEDNIVATNVVFKKPKAKGGFAIGTSFGGDE